MEYQLQEKGGGMEIKLPIGIENFNEIRNGNYYYIDKTGFIKNLLGRQFKANLITRPRRFGKTLTMSMLEDFFDISRDSRQRFEGTDIAGYKGICTEWMNQWPVLFITLKNIEGLNFDSAFIMLGSLIADICKKYIFLDKSDRVDADDLVIYRKLKAQEADTGMLKNSLYTLMRMMASHYCKPVILLIDEYDVPLAQASEAGYYNDMIDVIRSLLGKALKTNEYLKFAVITGCLRISKESIFTGMNNLVSDTITGGCFEGDIGFKADDVHKILSDTGFINHTGEIKEWYDGYLFGKVNVYCPWDVLNHVAALQANPDARPGMYWENTSHNGIIRKFIERKDLWGTEQINEDFETLLDGGYIIKEITDNLTYDMLHSSADNLWSLLYLTGYLTKGLQDEVSREDIPGTKVVLKIPNQEIRNLYKTTVKEWFTDTVQATDRNDLFNAIWGQDAEKCTNIISGLLFDTISYFDYKEDFYHAFLLGILSYAGYEVKSNREQGEGRPDIFLYDNRKHRAVIFELKVAVSVKSMDSMCDKALGQIQKKRYAGSLEDEYDTIICYGISFYKKRCKVKTWQNK